MCSKAHVDALPTFTFIQNHFDLICSDLSQVRVAEAVTASSAVPVVFPALVFENFAGECDYDEPPWLQESLLRRKEAPRRFHIASELNAYTDRDDHPYLHLVDGGIADNLGVRGPLDAVIIGGGIWGRFTELGEKPPKQLVFIVVNSATEPARSFRHIPQPPPLGDIISLPFENNFAERQIRPAVILRKNSQSNRSDQGAATQGVLMSVYRTLRLRGLDPTKTIADALKTYLTTGQLPPLPA